MTIFLFILCTITCLGLGACLITYFLKYSQTQESWQALWHGFKEGLKGAGFLFPRKYPVELYIWKISDDDEACENCLERASWEPMDIADWMKEGLPGTPEAETECGENCRCKLVLYKPANQKLPRR